MVTRVLGIIVLAAAISTCSGPSTSAPAETVRLRLAANHGTQYLGYYMAQEKGFYAARGLSVEFALCPGAASPEKAIRLMAGGESDFAAGLFGPVADHAVLSGVVVLDCVYRASPAALYARNSSGIRNPLGFPGHTIATPGRNWDAAVTALLTSLGVDPAAVTLCSLDGYGTTIFNDDTDIIAGFLTEDIVLSRLQGYDIIIWPLYEYGITASDNGLFASRSRLETDPHYADVATRFQEASYEGWEWAVMHPEEAVDIMLTAFPSLALEREFHRQAFAAAVPLIRGDMLPDASPTTPFGLTSRTGTLAVEAAVITAGTASE